MFTKSKGCLLHRWQSRQSKRERKKISFELNCNLSRVTGEQITTVLFQTELSEVSPDCLHRTIYAFVNESAYWLIPEKVEVFARSVYWTPAASTAIEEIGLATIRVAKRFATMN